MSSFHDEICRQRRIESFIIREISQRSLVIGMTGATGSIGPTGPATPPSHKKNDYIDTNACIYKRIEDRIDKKKENVKQTCIFFYMENE